MAVQPYDNCPCESGKKFRFCCQKVAKYGDRAEEMLSKGQVAGALQAIDEGLGVDPQNMWLRTMKVRTLLGTHDHDAARPVIASILESHPSYRPVLLLRLQDELAHASVSDAVATLQEIIDATPSGGIKESLAWMAFLGRAIADLGLVFPALAHLRVASSDADVIEAAGRTVATLEGSAGVPPWLRDIYELAPAPSGVAVERWSNGIALAARGRWQRAAAIFEAIAAEHPQCAPVWFNLGLCQAWLAQIEAAAQALERYATLEQNHDSAVDALALAQCLDTRESAQTVDVIHVHYRIRDHSRLLQKLKDHPRFQVHMLDAQQDELGEGVKDEFYLLDKDSVNDSATVTMENLPAIVGVVRTRGKELELEFAEPINDDPRPVTTVEAAGDAIEPDGSRSVVGTIPVSTYRLRRMWGVPSGTPMAMRRVRQMVHDQNYRDVWQDTPLGWLGNRTPSEASGIPELKLPLRAAVLINEYSCEVPLFDIDMDALRRRLGLENEPWIDGEGVDIGRLPLARLRYVRSDSLPTPALKALFDRVTRFAMPLAIERAAAALVARPADRDQFDSVSAFHSLVDLARHRADRAAAVGWLEQARRFDAEAGVPERPTWDIVEWETSFHFDAMQHWAPRLAQLVKKLERNKEASQELMLVLVRTRIVRFVPHPSEPDRVVMDARLLEQILSRFENAQTGMIDLTPVAGQAGKIWTPGGQSIGESPIILPGQESPARQRSKLVIPGS
jgi:tetratricopeptide (TPR) repeat protein